MTYDEWVDRYQPTIDHINGHAFRTVLATLCPNYSLGVDNDGQLIIYTNKVQGENDTYEEME